MKVLILGSGVIGTSLAYYLTKAGHEVTVVDRQAGPGLETSYANAGEVSPGYAAPWAAPGIPLKALKWAFMRYRPLVIWPLPDPAMWRWGLAMLMNCTASRYEINKGRMVRLAEYSRDCLRDLRAETGIRYDERCLGTLQVFRTAEQLEGTAKDIAVLEQSGVAYELLDRDGCVRAEPALGLVREKVAHESDLELVEAILRNAFAAVGRYVPEARREEEAHAFFLAAWDILRAAPQGDAQIIWARALIDVAIIPEDIQLLLRIVDGQESVPGLTI